MLKKITILLIITFLFLALSKGVLAKRRLPQASEAVITTTTKTNSNPSARGVTSTVKFRSDRNAVIISLSNLGSASDVEYSLSYVSKGVTQGVNGSITPGSETSVTRELLFGTCSAGICRYDSGITDARLTITTKTNSGLTILKPYKLKV